MIALDVDKCGKKVKAKVKVKVRISAKNDHFAF